MIIFLLVQTILRMHEREEKMKERLMDLRLKSEEQVFNVWFLSGISILNVCIFHHYCHRHHHHHYCLFFSDQHHLLIDIGSLPLGQGSRGAAWVTKGKQSGQQVGDDFDQDACADGDLH